MEHAGGRYDSSSVYTECATAQESFLRDVVASKEMKDLRHIH